VRDVSHKIICIIFLGIIALTTGCASTPEQEVQPLVYPPPPAEPRFVYERSLRYSDNIEKISTTEKLKRIATGTPRKLKGLVKPYDVASHEGRVYITDTVQKVVIMFDIPAGEYREFGRESPGTLTKPIGIDVSDDGEVFVCDISAKRVLIYDSDGHYLRSIGNPSQLQRPSDVTVDTLNKRVYIVNTGGVSSDTHNIQVYDLTTGAYVQTIGSRGQKPGEFNLPLQATVAQDGTLYVVDSGNFRVQAFDSKGNFKMTFGTLGRYPGQFARPKGIATDHDGNIYVVDTAFGNIQIFNPQGQLLLFIGARSQTSKPGNYMLPAGIDVDAMGRIYVVDQFFRKVDIYRPAALQEGEGLTSGE